MVRRRKRNGRRIAGDVRGVLDIFLLGSVALFLLSLRASERRTRFVLISVQFWCAVRVLC